MRSSVVPSSSFDGDAPRFLSPKPWTSSTLSEIFTNEAVVAGSTSTIAYYGKLLQKALVRQRHAAQSPLLWGELLRDGLLEVGAVGFDFTWLSSSSSSSTPPHIVNDSRALAALQLTAFAGGGGGAQVARSFWRHDQPTRRLPCGAAPAAAAGAVAPPCDAAQRSAFGAGQLSRWPPRAGRPHDPAQAIAWSLHALGYAKVDDWRAWGLDVDALERYARAKLDASTATVASGGRGSAGSGAAQPLPPPVRRYEAPGVWPPLQPLLDSAALATALRGYLGGPVRFDGAIALELSERVNLTNYASGFWHHDRCGKRLKLFVLLNDVAEATGRPTQIALGTHNAMYHAYSYVESRLQDSYVRARHRVASMTGRRGGGFLFDTNALHRGKVDGARGGKTGGVGPGAADVAARRLAVILEFHAVGKLQPVLAKNQFPCPSSSTAPRGGTPGLTHYAVDDLK